MTESEAQRCVAILRAAYPAATFPRETVALYMSILLPHDRAQVEGAIKACVATSRYLPTLAELFERMTSAALGAPTPEEAWGEVLRAVGRWGRYRTPEWSHETVASAVACIGWQSICDSDHEASLRRAFLDAYKGLETRGKGEAQVAALTGRSGQERRLGAVTIAGALDAGKVGDQ